MTLSDRLTPLSEDDTLTPSAATRLVREVLGSQAPEAAERVYRALRTWTWKALTARRYDAEVRAWRELVRGAAAAVRATQDDAVAVKLGVLSDLLYESITFGEHEPLTSVLQRAHVRQLLMRMSDHHPVGRDRLAAALGLKDSNLSRVLLLLISAGLVDREQVGRAASFRLTRRGEEARKSVLKDHRVRLKRRTEQSDRGAPVNARGRDQGLRAQGRGRIHRHSLAGAIDHAPNAAPIAFTRFEPRKREADRALVEIRQVVPVREEFSPALDLVAPTLQTRTPEPAHG